MEEEDERAVAAVVSHWPQFEAALLGFPAAHACLPTTPTTNVLLALSLPTTPGTTPCTTPVTSRVTVHSTAYELGGQGVIPIAIVDLPMPGVSPCTATVRSLHQPSCLPVAAANRALAILNSARTQRLCTANSCGIAY